MTQNGLGDQDQTEIQKPSHLPERPDRKRVFYANSVTWLFMEGQEAVLDFKLVMPEDYKDAIEKGKEADGWTTGEANIALDHVPVEVRIYMPFNQFARLIERMSKTWQKWKETAKDKDQEPGTRNG